MSDDKVSVKEALEKLYDFFMDGWIYGVVGLEWVRDRYKVFCERSDLYV